MMDISYSNGSFEVINLLIESGHPFVGMGKFTQGLYKGTSPLHLAIINNSLSAVTMILNSEDNHELLHLRAVSTPLQNIFPTIELPLNLAVWMGDANIVSVLIEKGAEMCRTDGDGNNPMHVVSLLAAQDPDKALHMLEVLLDAIDAWLENTTKCKALMDLSLKKGRLVALHMLFKCDNKTRLTPLKLAAKSGCRGLVRRILNIDKLYRFPLYKLGPKSESLYDFSEIDPLLSHDQNTMSIIEMLVFEETDQAIEILGLPQITTLKDIKTKCLKIMLWVVIIFHILFMIMHSVAFYVWLLPEMMSTTNNATMTDRYAMQEVDIFILIIGCCYMGTVVLAALGCVRIFRRMRLGLWNITYVVYNLQLPTLGSFAISLILYFILKAMKNEYEVFMLSLSMLFGWIHCIYFTRAFQSTSFFALMLHRVLFADILRFLSIIAIMVLSYTMMTSAILMMDVSLTEHINDNHDITNPTNPIPIMFDFFQLASGIADFSLLQESSYWFICGAIYISFLVIANILMFNLLIASMSNRYALISANGELLCTKVTLCDIIMWEFMIPNRLKNRARSIYEHRIVRVSLNAEHYIENHVYLLKAPDPDCQTLHIRLARQRSTIH